MNNPLAIVRGSVLVGVEELMCKGEMWGPVLGDQGSSRQWYTAARKLYPYGKINNNVEQLVLGLNDKCRC